jgi:exonuclease VII small subunit
MLSNPQVIMGVVTLLAAMAAYLNSITIKKNTNGRLSQAENRIAQLTKHLHENNIEIPPPTKDTHNAGNS